MKIYETHQFDTGWNDLQEIKWYANPHKAMDALTESAGCYVEWKQMGQYHYAGLTSADPKDSFYIVYIRDVIE